jgi:predicted trehalose synthase
MTDPGTLLRDVDPARLGDWVRARRWFGAKAAEGTTFAVVDVIGLRGDPPLSCVLVEARFVTGDSDLYQLLVEPREPTGETDPAVIARTGGGAELVDALVDPREAAVLVRLMERSAEIEAGGGTVGFHWTGTMDPLPARVVARPMGAEQSNSTIVLDEALALKVFRRLLPGENPELEMLRFLSARGFGHIAQLAGWYELTGGRLEATLGILQRFVADGRDGWDFALDEPEAFLERAGELGEVTALMHTVLGSDDEDPDFAPEVADDDALAAVLAATEEEIGRAFAGLTPALEGAAPIAGREDEVRARLHALGRHGGGGKLIRHHGDYHLGQTLVEPDRWILLDFEGEPARPLPERRTKRSPLRDVAGMLRSFAYAASAFRLLRDREPPEGWEAHARRRFLDGYRNTVDPALLPDREEAVDDLLAVFELEKALYELRYERNNRPDWVGIPVAAIQRVIEAPAQA